MKNFLNFCIMVCLVPVVWIALYFLIHLLLVIGMLLLIGLPIIGLIWGLISFVKEIYNEIKSENDDNRGTD